MFLLAFCFQNSVWYSVYISDGKKSQTSIGFSETSTPWDSSVCVPSWNTVIATEINFLLLYIYPHPYIHAHPHKLIESERWQFHRSKIGKTLCLSKLTLLNVAPKEYSYFIDTIISSFQDHQNGGNFCFSEEHLSRTEQKSSYDYHIHIIILNALTILMTHP